MSSDSKAWASVATAIAGPLAAGLAVNFLSKAPDALGDEGDEEAGHELMWIAGIGTLAVFTIYAATHAQSAADASQKPEAARLVRSRGNRLPAF